MGSVKLMSTVIDKLFIIHVFLNSKLIAGASIDYSPNDYWSYQIDLAAKLRADGKSVEKYTITKERPDIKIADYNAKIYNTAAYLQYDFEPIQIVSQYHPDFFLFRT